jgi:phosphoribosylglycinamide formyltransferase-1
MTKLVFLVNGNGGNFKFIHLAKKLDILNNIKISIISYQDCPAIDYSKQQDIEHYIINYSRLDNNSKKEFISLLKSLNPDLIITTWKKIIDDETVEYFYGKMINLHYSLLPSFAGLIGTKPLEEAYNRGCKFIGPTCHLVDKEVDAGKIIAQAVFPTNIPLTDAISKMFKTGCFVLLNGILTILNQETIINEKFLSEHAQFGDILFNPPLKINPKIFDSDFWETLRRL